MTSKVVISEPLRSLQRFVLYVVRYSTICGDYDDENFFTMAFLAYKTPYVNTDKAPTPRPIFSILSFLSWLSVGMMSNG